MYSTIFLLFHGRIGGFNRNQIDLNAPIVILVFFLFEVFVDEISA